MVTQRRAACLGHNGDTLGVDRSQVGVLKDADLQGSTRAGHIAKDQERVVRGRTAMKVYQVRQEVQLTR
jgi:hypothetical protein